MPCCDAVKFGDTPRSEPRVVEIERFQRSLAGRSHVSLRLFLAVEKPLHQPLRLAGQEGLSEYADAQVDGFG